MQIQQAVRVGVEMATDSIQFYDSIQFQLVTHYNGLLTQSTQKLLFNRKQQ